MSVAVGVAFLVLISLVAGVGYLGLDAMDSLHEDACIVAGTQWTDVQMASEALTYSNQNSRITTQIFLTDDLREVHVLLARRADNSAKISAILQQLQSRSASDKAGRDGEEAEPRIIGAHIRGCMGKTLCRVLNINSAGLTTTSR